MLKDLDVEVKFNVDAKCASSYPFFRGKTIDRIHFNFPHDRSSFKARTLPKLIADFFQESAKLQQDGGKIYMALPKPPQQSKRDFYYGYIYGIVEASAKAGYVLYNKRKFDGNRYPGYKHVMTGASASATVAENAREYIFQKTSLTYQEILSHSEYGPREKEWFYGEERNVPKNIPTDTESSDESGDECELQSERRPFMI